MISFIMNEVLINKIESLLPDKLEELAKFIDNLLSTKIQDKLTNQAYQIEDKKITCDRCSTSYVVKNGLKNGTQRYKCKNCNKFFSINTNSILSHSKITYNQLMIIIKGVLDLKPLCEICVDAKLSIVETYYTEIKIFETLEKTYSDVKLKGIVQVDEQYFKLNLKGTKKENMPRKSRKSGSQNLTSGISNEQVCVIEAIDEYDNIIMNVVGSGPPSTETISKCLKGKIAEGSILVTDSKSSYVRFAKDNNLILKQIPAGKHSVETIYNLNDLNSLMFEVETYVNYIKRGISTRHLQQHLNFIRYRKILKYTLDYLERNKKMYKDSIILISYTKCRQICKSELPVDISAIYC